MMHLNSTSKKNTDLMLMMLYILQELENEDITSSHFTIVHLNVGYTKI